MSSDQEAPSSSIELNSSESSLVGHENSATLNLEEETIIKPPHELETLELTMAAQQQPLDISPPLPPPQPTTTSKKRKKKDPKAPRRPLSG